MAGEMPKFASHNVQLNDGTWTGGNLPLVVNSSAYQAALRELNKLVWERNRKGTTMVDLGSLEGGYAAEFAKHGYDVTGVEGREENHVNAVWLQEALGLPNLRFYCDDARDFLRGKKFDIVFCSGLLYHLDRPVAFLKQVGKACQQFLILNTHYSMPNGHPEHTHAPGSGCTYGDFTNEGRKGHWYKEGTTRWDSVDNDTSFWLTKESLVATLKEDCGFSQVEEIDWQNVGDSSLRHHVPGGPGLVNDRGMFVAFK